MPKYSLHEASMAIVNEIIRFSPILDKVAHPIHTLPAKSYGVRELVGEEGYFTFTPKVTYDFLGEFKRLAEGAREEFSGNILRYGADTLERFVASLKGNILTSLIKYAENRNFAENIVPYEVGITINSFETNISSWSMARIMYPFWSDEVYRGAKREMRGYKSPKLSRLLVRIFGESHPVIKWYTNICPKDMPSVRSDQYRITVSTLPHHMAGMSYYSSHNHGGDKWAGSQGGTSCMDPMGNGTGETICSLIATLKADNIFIAYLSKSCNDDLLSPVYEARCLIHLVEDLERGSVALGCRLYGTSNETKELLATGLKEALGVIPARMVRDVQAAGTTLTRVTYLYDEPCIFHTDDIQDDDGDWIYIEGAYTPYTDEDYIDINEDGRRVHYELPHTLLGNIDLSLWRRQGKDPKEPAPENNKREREQKVISDILKEILAFPDTLVFGHD